MDAAVRAWRKDRRAELISARMAVAPDARRAAGEVVFAAVLAHLGSAHCVAIYWPFRGELNPLPFADRVIASGSAVALPVVTEKNAPLAFRVWTPGAPMARGVWDIPYPAKGEAAEPDLIIAPLVGFDAAGYRLGYGGGYYDRTLAARPARVIGVGLELGRLDSIRPQPHDVPMDAIMTEAGVFPSPLRGGLGEGAARVSETRPAPVGLLQPSAPAERPLT